MHKEGHIGAALLVYSPLGLLNMLLADSQLAFIGAVVAAGLTMLPDIDMCIPLLRHRGPTHTVWFALVVRMFVGLLGGAIGAGGGPFVALEMESFGFLVGTFTICSHPLADALTPVGIRPFLPRNDVEYTFRVARASNSIANYLLLVFGIGICAVTFRIVSVIK